MMQEVNSGPYRILHAENGHMSQLDIPSDFLGFVQKAPHTVAGYFPGFVAVLPEGPYTTQESGTHFMAVPMSDVNKDIKDLTSEELQILSGLILTQIQLPDHVVSINIGLENEILRRDESCPVQKRSPRTMPFYHAHFITLPSPRSDKKYTFDTQFAVRNEINEIGSDTDRKFYRRKLKEPFGQLIEAVLRSEFGDEFDGFRVTPKGEMRGTGEYPHMVGALDFEIPPDCTPEQLGHFLQVLDVRYRRLHRAIFGGVIQNYDNLANNGFSGELKITRDVRIPKRNMKRKIHDRVKRIARKAAESDLNTFKDDWGRIFRIPSYSLGIADGVVTFMPHINTGRGGTEALGITMVREHSDGKENGARDQRADRTRGIIPAFLEAAKLRYPEIFEHRRMEYLLPQSGLGDYSLDARTIAQLAGIANQEEVNALVMQFPTNEYVYQDAWGLLDAIQEHPTDRAFVWTEGEDEHQASKLNLSGILSDKIQAYISRNKIEILKDIFNIHIDGHTKEIVIVDDKISKLRAAKAKIDELKESGDLRDIPVRLIWMAHDSKTHRPNDEDDLEFIGQNALTYNSLEEVKELLYGNDQNGDDHRLILLDFDRTLLNTQYYLMGLGRAIDQSLKIVNSAVAM